MFQHLLKQGRELRNFLAKPVLAASVMIPLLLILRYMVRMGDAGVSQILVICSTLLASEFLLCVRN